MELYNGLVCKGICKSQKQRFKGLNLSKKGLDTFSCNECGFYMPLILLEQNMYLTDEMIINLVLTYKGANKLRQLIVNPRTCFCCGKRFSVRLRGSYVSLKKTSMEIDGYVKRY